MVPYSESKIKAVKRRDLEVEPPPELRGGKKINLCGGFRELWMNFVKPDLQSALKIDRSRKFLGAGICRTAAFARLWLRLRGGLEESGEVKNFRGCGFERRLGI